MSIYNLYSNISKKYGVSDAKASFAVNGKVYGITNQYNSNNINQNNSTFLSKNLQQLQDDPDISPELIEVEELCDCVRLWYCVDTENGKECQEIGQRTMSEQNPEAVGYESKEECEAVPCTPMVTLTPSVSPSASMPITPSMTSTITPTPTPSLSPPPSPTPSLF